VETAQYQGSRRLNIRIQGARLGMKPAVAQLLGNGTVTALCQQYDADCNMTHAEEWSLSTYTASQAGVWNGIALTGEQKYSHMCKDFHANLSYHNPSVPCLSTSFSVAHAQPGRRHLHPTFTRLARVCTCTPLQCTHVPHAQLPHTHPR
jgi:hypothetical protein